MTVEYCKKLIISETIVGLWAMWEVFCPDINHEDCIVRDGDLTTALLMLSTARYRYLSIDRPGGQDVWVEVPNTTEATQ